MSNMDEESRTNFLLGIRCYQELMRQLSEFDTQAAAAAAAAAAQPSAGDNDQLVGAAGVEAPPSNHHESDPPGHLLHDSRLCVIMETLCNEDFLRGFAAAAEGGSFDDLE